MNTTYDRESFVRSCTADLSRQVDDILDRRFTQIAKDPQADADPMDPSPIVMVRTLIKNLARK